MEKVTLKSLGMEGIGEEPSTPDEFNAIANKGKTGADVKDVCTLRAREYIRFHVTLGNIRELFLHGQKGVAATPESPVAIEEVIGVEDATKIARKTKPILKDGKPVVKDGEAVVDWDETQGDYFKRVVAQLVADGQHASEDEAKQSFQGLFDQCIKIVGFPAAKSTSEGRAPTKLAAKYKLGAGLLLAGFANLSRFTTAYLDTLGKELGFVPTNDTTKTYLVEHTGKDGAKKSATVSDKDADTLGWLVKAYNDKIAANAQAAANAALQEEV